jgi:hypothetical protein
MKIRRISETGVSIQPQRTQGLIGDWSTGAFQFRMLYCGFGIADKKTGVLE